MSYAFDREKHTICRRSEFLKLYDQGRRSQSGELCVFYLPGEAEADVRAGFTVSKKNGKAWARNKIKRRLKEIYRLHLAEIAPGSQLVFLARPRIRNLSYWELDALVLKLLGRLRVWSKSC